MSDWYVPVMFVLFAAHLVPFIVIGLKRRQWYYLAPVITFSLLTAAFGLRLFAPEFQVADMPLHQPVRYAAWAACAVSIPLFVLRIRQRRRARAESVSAD